MLTVSGHLYINEVLSKKDTEKGMFIVFEGISQNVRKKELDPENTRVYQRVVVWVNKEKQEEAIAKLVKGANIIVKYATLDGSKTSVGSYFNEVKTKYEYVQFLKMTLEGNTNNEQQSVSE